MQNKKPLVNEVVSNPLLKMENSNEVEGYLYQCNYPYINEVSFYFLHVKVDLNNVVALFKIRRKTV